MTSSPNDADLLAAQAGDTAAISRLLHANRHGVYRYGLERDPEGAEGKAVA